MSQIFNTSVSASPTVPTSFVTDSGTATPAVNILNVLGGDTTANDADGIRTIGSGNTVTVELTNRLQGTGTTTGAVTADLITFGLGASAAVYRFSFIVSGRDTGTGDGVGYEVLASARTNGAAATVVQTPWVDSDEDASLIGASIDLVASANNIVLRVTGVAGQTINYSAVGTYVVV